MSRFTALLAALGALGTGLVLLREVNHGVRVGGDSLTYLSVARSLSEGRGFVLWNGHMYENAAPFFPLALAFARLLGLDAMDAAGYVNATAFGLTVFTTAMWLRRRVASRFLVVWAGLACVLSPLLAQLSAWTMTESLFVLFTTLSLSTLDRFLDTGQRSCLLRAAICAALACLTRYIGVTVVASALLLLLWRRSTTFTTKTKDAALYAVMALTPIGVWMSRNFLNSGTWTGQLVASDFTWPSTLHTASSEFIRWTLGDLGFALLRTWSAQYFNITISPAPSAVFAIRDPAMDGVFLMIHGGLVLAIGAGYVLVRLRSSGYVQSVGTWAVPVVFGSVYTLVLISVLLLEKPEFYPRFLAPLYVPALVMATLILQECLRWTAERPALDADIAGRDYASRPVRGLTVLLVVGLSLWLTQQVYANYRDIKFWMGSSAYSGWSNFETVRYLRTHSPRGDVLTNRAAALYAVTDIPQDRLHALWTWQPDSWIVNTYADGTDMHFVWFHGSHQPLFELEELAALPGMEMVEVLEDGVILRQQKSGRASAAKAQSRNILSENALQHARRIVRAFFTVYLDEKRNRLIYVRSECRDEDMVPPFFLHLIPVDPADLPENRRPYTFDNLDFSFHNRGFTSDGKCVAIRNLPSYDIAEIRTGQLTSEGQLWKETFRLATQ